jgi:hypothetical protein
MSGQNSDLFGNAQNGKGSPTPTTRQRSASYPRFTLQQVEKLAQTVFDSGPRNCDADIIAKSLKYSNAKNGSFVGLRATAAQFGLITASRDLISVTEEWIQVFLSGEFNALQSARRYAISRPDLYRQIIDDYKGRQLPTIDRLAKELHINPKYEILKEAAVSAAQVFEDSVQYAGILDARRFLKLDSNQNLDSNESSSIQEESTDPNDQKASASPNASKKPEISETIFDSPPSEGMDRLEIKLRGGKKAYILVPVPLPKGEKERLKSMIDLLLEDEENAQ